MGSMAETGEGIARDGKTNPNRNNRARSPGSAAPPLWVRKPSGNAKRGSLVFRDGHIRRPAAMPNGVNLKPVGCEELPLHPRQFVGLDAERFADAVQKAAGGKPIGNQPTGDLFPASHLVPHTVVEPIQPKEGF